MRFLIVGAGRVGVVYAHHAQQGGAHVGLFVREKYAAAARADFHLYPLHEGKRAHKTFRANAVLTNWAEVAQTKWDWIFLAIPSSSLEGAWFDEMKAAIGEARVVALQLGVNDRQWLEQQLGRDRLYLGMINLISYSVPMEGHPVGDPGTAYWFPPCSSMPFSGPSSAPFDELVATLRKGGMKASIATDSQGASRFPEFLLGALVTALELVGWKFSGLRDDEAIRLAIAAAEEQNAILDRKLGTRRPFYFSVLSPRFMRGGLWVASKMVPLPMESFILAHFTKVNAQFQRDRKTLMVEGARLGLPTSAIQELDRRLAELRISALK